MSLWRLYRHQIGDSFNGRTGTERDILLILPPCHLNLLFGAIAAFGKCKKPLILLVGAVTQSEATEDLFAETEVVQSDTDKNLKQILVKQLIEGNE